VREGRVGVLIGVVALVIGGVVIVIGGVVWGVAAFTAVLIIFVIVKWG
jgi:hypothetical protein